MQRARSVSNPSTRVKARTSSASVPPPKPASVHIDLHAMGDLPDDLKQLTNWLVWKWWWDQTANKGAGKWTKPPVDYATGIDIDATDSANWMTFPESMERGQHYDGSGFALGPE